MSRVEWESLPSDAREAVQAEIGPIVKVEPISEGRRTALVSQVQTATDRVFIKGTPVTESRADNQLRREVAINSYVAPIAPALVCQIEAAGWRLVGFEYVAGHRADYSLDSPDLPRVLETLATLDQLDCPSSAPLLWFEARWSSYVSRPRQQLPHLAGNALLHTDLNPTNVRIAPHRTALVDWAAASRGPAVINAADFVLVSSLAAMRRVRLRRSLPTCRPGGRPTLNRSTSTPGPSLPDGWICSGATRIHGPRPSWMLRSVG